MFTTSQSDWRDDVSLMVACAPAPVGSGARSSIRLSSHARERLEQRGITEWAVQFAINFGEVFYGRSGSEIVYLSKRAQQAARHLVGGRVFELRDLAVIISRDGTIRTAFRAKRPLKRWRGKR